MPDQVQLRIPGPTPLPEPVREAGAHAMVNHRGPEFKELLLRVTSAMKKGFQTDNRGPAAHLVGYRCARDRRRQHALGRAISVLSVNIGNFGERFAKIARRYGAVVTSYTVEQGQAAVPAEVGNQLRAMAAAGTPAKAVLVTHNETSTGVTNPLEQIAREIRAVAPTR